MTDDSVTAVDVPARRPSASEPVTRLDHFQILEPIGHGGMGAVYSAYDLRLDRKVAIKLLHPSISEADDEVLAQRLLREAQAMAKLSHPNVVPIYEVGRANQTVFIAMERRSLARRGARLCPRDE